MNRIQPKEHDLERIIVPFGIDGFELPRPGAICLARNDQRCRDGRPTTPEIPCSMTGAKGGSRTLRGPSVSGKYLMICTFESMLVVGAEEVRASSSLGSFESSLMEWS